MLTTTGTPKRTVEILLVEDNLTDSFFMRLALRQSRRPFKLTIAKDGDEAMEFLREFEAREALPKLILLDLRLPGRSGWDVLSEIKRDEALRGIPVIVVSGFNNEGEVERAREMERVTYLVKPIDMVNFLELPRVVDRILDGY